MGSRAHLDVAGVIRLDAEAAPDGRRVPLLLVAAWCDAVIPRMIQSLTTPKFRRSAGIDYGGYTAAAATTQDAFRIAIVGICTLLIVDSVRRRRPLQMWTLTMFLAPWVCIALRDLVAHHNPSIDALLFPLVGIALWAAGPPLQSLRVLAHLTALAAALSMAMAVIDPPSSLFRSNQGVLIVEDKQIIPSGMLAGFLTQPNNLGQFIVLGLPAVVLIRGGRLRLAYFAICTFAIVWTASRTSLYALAIACLAAAILWLARGRQVRWALSIGLIGVPFVTVCALPLMTTDPSSFSERGFIWRESLPAWYEDVWFGQGASWYRDLAMTSDSIASSAFQGHNQLVQLLVTGGLLYAAVTAAMIAVAAVAAIRHAERGEDYGVLYLVALAGTCLLEVSLVTVDNSSMFPMVVVPLAVILFGPSASPRGLGGSSLPARVPRAAGSAASRQPATGCIGADGRNGPAAAPRVLVPYDAGHAGHHPEGV